MTDVSPYFFLLFLFPLLAWPAVILTHNRTAVVEATVFLIKKNGTGHNEREGGQRAYNCV